MLCFVQPVIESHSKVSPHLLSRDLVFHHILGNYGLIRDRYMDSTDTLCWYWDRTETILITIKESKCTSQHVYLYNRFTELCNISTTNIPTTQETKMPMNTHYSGVLSLTRMLEKNVKNMHENMCTCCFIWVSFFIKYLHLDKDRLQLLLCSSSLSCCNSFLLSESSFSFSALMHSTISFSWKRF